MRTDRRIALALSLVLSWGCSRPPAGAARPPTSPDSAGATSESGQALHRYLPLPHGSVLTFRDPLPRSSTEERLILQISHRNPERASLRSGDSVRRVVYASDGVRLLGGGYLLREPLELSASYRGPLGQVVVTGIDRLVEVPAGRFSGCIETTETSGTGLTGRQVVTTYCPDVGIVTFSAMSGNGERHFELESFGPGVDVEAL